MTSPISAPVDISTIEAAKENILPLQSGRSATHLASVLGSSTSSTRSGLGVKLELEHQRFRSQISAVETWERTGEWDESLSSSSGLKLNEVIQLSEDPLDISHQYVRFIISNYPSGANASNKLVPVLEETTRRFLGDERYTNDPRYFRLWAHYAKNMEQSSEECYRFLFAKGIGEKLAALYEEYAKVLESVGKRKQADQIYLLGINRRATPLDRLKRSHLDFQARMLVAPPLPSPPRPSPSDSDSSRTVRPILASSSTTRPATGGTGTTGGTGVGPKGNGSMFAVFRDDSSSSSAAGAGGAGQEAEWDDFGTVKSRKRENDQEKKEWNGETMPQSGGVRIDGQAPVAAGGVFGGGGGGGFKLEVYRDETATALPTSHSLLESDVFTRSNRAPSEAEQLRINPFKNYSSADVDLLTKDPLENLQVLAPTSSSSSSSSTSGVKKIKKTTSSTSASTTGEKKRVKSSSSSSSSSSSKSKPSSSSSTSTTTATSAAESLEPRPQQISFKLEILRSTSTRSGWISFEEERVNRRAAKYVLEEVENWGGWEFRERWEEEFKRTGRTTYKIDQETGWPVLYDSNGAPLYDFLRPPTPVKEATPPPRPIEVEVPPPSPSPIRAASPVRSSPSRTPPRLDEGTDEPQSPPSDSFVPIDPNAPPSPTINTKAANAFLDGLFAKTLDFTRFNGKTSHSTEDDDDESRDDPSETGEEPSTEDSSSSSSSSEDDDEENDGFQHGIEFNLAASQFSTQQGGTQASEVSNDDGMFVPFSQTRSSAGDDSSFFGSQSQEPINVASQQGGGGGYGQGLYALNENDENDENVTPPVVGAPMQLFRDVTPSSSTSSAGGGGGGGFRPVTKTSRAPLGAKPFSSLPLDSRQAPIGSFSVFNDTVLPSSSSRPNSENDYEEHPAEDYEAPLRDGEEDGQGSPERFSQDLSDGYAMGRRERGVPSRYAPFVDNMTPITERTLEITAAMNNTNNLLSTSQRSRRSSAFSGNPAPVLEDDEPSTEEEEDEDDDEVAGDRAFVASYEAGGGGIDQSNEASSDEDGNSSDSSTDSEEDNGLQPPPSHQPAALSVLPDPSTFDESSISRLSISAQDQQPPSFDISPNTSLPEGLTIAGNQSGMTTGMVIADSTSTGQLSESSIVDPYDSEMLFNYLSSLPTPIQQHPLVVDLSSRSAEKLAGLQKTAKKRANSKTKDRTGTMDEAWDLELDGEVFSVREKLGEGSFGAVYRIAFAADDEEEGGDQEEDEFDLEGTELFVAVKIERPTNYWELFVLDQMQERLSERARESILTPHRLYAYSDESYLLLDLCDRGTLLNAVNKAQEYRIAPPGAGTTGLDELLAIFFTIELLRTLESFHSAGFIHGDMKIDNCLLRFEDVEGSWQTIYEPTGANGWGRKGLKVIDYGRSIDTTMYEPGQRFSCELKTDKFDCIEMQTNGSWTYEPDYHGVASIAYCTLFGHYMEIESVQVEGGKSKRVPKQAFRRYHQIELWTKLFDLLLNPRDVRPDGSLPITNELVEMRVELEEWLKASCNKNGKSLKSLLSKL
ncbi:uncharacterized protein JCM6883_005576 [Sporobolomyces salmoneus]|uniref:uncharacterized protein n=1 Tax=Sporobolomyces salmoneus TaxID=183962 RepID=UPI00317FA49A